MFGRKKAQTHEEVRAQIEAARTAASEAEEAESGLIERRGRLESLVSYLEERREQNHFGRDFTIAMTPRKRRS